MADPQKLVLMIQPTRLQGLIWQTVLRSQQIQVIWEAPETDLMQNMSQLIHAGLALPDLLLIDMRLRNFNPYAFCRWCRENCPGLKVILVNAVQKEIIPSERQWAILQGAEDLLPGFDVNNLVASVTSSLRRVLDGLDAQPLDNGALISVLLSMKRQIESRRMGASGMSGRSSLTTQDRTASTRPPAPASAPSPVAASNGHKTTQPPIGNGALVPKGTHPLATSALNGHSHAPLEDDAEAWLEANPSHRPATDGEGQAHDLPPDEPPPTRRYRGRAY